ncbi:hypothetical protein ACFV30_39725 [Streptomyces sp. NPDC059752]|uniref:hypothetical protein n=1 Tax=unclassified Streptomyces TaxID=2593676 RepID=UPI003658B69C
MRTTASSPGDHEPANAHISTTGDHCSAGSWLFAADLIEALQGPYSAERWRHWLEAAAVFGDAVTEHAKQYGLENRFKLEKDVVTKALHPSSAEG